MSSTHMIAVFQTMVEGTTRVIDAFVTAATPALVGNACHEGIQGIRQLPGSTEKDQAKDNFAQASSLANMFVGTKAGIDVGRVLIEHWPHLTTGERFIAAAGITLGVIGIGYAMVLFGVEHNVFAASLSAATGVASLKAAENFIVFRSRQHLASQKADTRPALEASEEGRYLAPTASPKIKR